MKVHINTVNVLNEVFIVRARVVFNESLNNCFLFTFRVQAEEFTLRSKITTLSLDRVTDSRKDSTDKCLVNFKENGIQLALNKRQKVINVSLVSAATEPTLYAMLGNGSKM